jgi:hypothetical protein
MVESKIRKSKYLNLRLTEEEHARLKELAQNYPTLSSFVLDACWHFNSKRHLHKLDYLEQKFEIIQNSLATLNRSAANLNELVQYTNHCMKMGIYQDKTSSEIIRILSEFSKNLVDYKQEMNNAKNDLKKSLRYL